jgi:Membrane carboxypeptidase/penicillin-binding protein
MAIKFINFKKQRAGGRKFAQILGKILAAGIVLVLAGAVLAGMVFIYYTRDLPRPEKFSEKTTIQSTKIYDRTKTFLLYEIYGEEKRNWVTFSEIPEPMKKWRWPPKTKIFIKTILVLISRASPVRF